MHATNSKDPRSRFSIRLTRNRNPRSNDPGAFHRRLRAVACVVAVVGFGAPGQVAAAPDQAKTAKAAKDETGSIERALEPHLRDISLQRVYVDELKL